MSPFSAICLDPGEEKDSVDSLLVVLAKSAASDPITQVTDHDDTAQVFGVDADALAPGKSAVIDASTLGYPMASLASLPAGDYVVAVYGEEATPWVCGIGPLRAR